MVVGEILCFGMPIGVGLKGSGDGEKNEIRGEVEN